MNDLRTNAWFRLTYFNPVETLRWLRQVETIVSSVPHDLSQTTLRLRDQGQKRPRELRDIAVFCHGIATKVLDVPILYSTEENQDFDSIATWSKDGNLNFTPIQLKELPPWDLNARVTLENLFTGLDRSPCLRDTVVAIKVNREMHLDLDALPAAPGHLGGLWLFGGASPDQHKWWLYGDMTARPTSYVFDYPAASPDICRVPLSYRLRATARAGGVR